MRPSLTSCLTESGPVAFASRSRTVELAIAAAAMMKSFSKILSSISCRTELRDTVITSYIDYIIIFRIVNINAFSILKEVNEIK